MPLRCYFTLAVIALLLSVTTGALAQQGKGNECTPAGVWYGGSAVAYHMTVIPAGPYTVFAEGMYKDGVMTTSYWGALTKKNHKYEGSLMQLYTADPDFLNMPPIGKMPDIRAGWSSMEMLNCNTIKNTLPFFGLYLARNIWEPGVLWNLKGRFR